VTLTSLSHAALEQAFNRYLQLDPQAQAQMASLHGQVIAFEILGLEQTLYLIPGADGVQLLAAYEGQPDCLLRGTPLALARMGNARQSSEQLFAGEVEIVGDTELAHRFGKLLGAIDIDWEEQLSRYSGDLVAHHVGNLVRDAGNWGRRTLGTLQLDLSEYLQEELHLLPVTAEVDGFLAQVDRLRDDVERLQLRIQRLSGAET